MQLKSSPTETSATANPAVVSLTEQIAPSYLRAVVEAVAIPRHYHAEAENNRIVKEWIEQEFRSLGYEVQRCGAFDNLVAVREGDPRSKPVLVGAHYDSVPGCPGADDNGSAIAALLGSARALADSPWVAGVVFVAFNREEDALLGSRDFVSHYLKADEGEEGEEGEMPSSGIKEAHILEMVGYTNYEPGSQRVLRGLPVKIRDVGDFLGVITNRDSNHIGDSILDAATVYVPKLPVSSLRTFLGMERYLPDLVRSDHAPFWEERIPAVMWTDTSEFRNPHYHQKSDTPDTLDYEFLGRVTQLLTALLVNRVHAHADA